MPQGGDGVQPARHMSARPELASRAGASSSDPVRDRETGVLDLLAVILREWKIVVLVTVATTLLAIGASLLASPEYHARTVLLPFAGTQSRTQLALAGLPAGVASLVGGGSAGSERLVGSVLASRSLADSLLARFKGAPGGAPAVGKILRKGLRTQTNPDGSIVIQVRANDPGLAAGVANAIPALVNQILARLGTEGAESKRTFLKSQADSAQKRLVQSEQRLVEFQQQASAPALEAQASRTIDAAATLQEGIYQKELEIAQLRRTATADNPQLRAALGELATRRGQLQRLTRGGSSNAVFVPMNRGPGLKVASVRLLREFGQEEKIFETLTAALAESQINASNEVPVLTVLDKAIAPGGPTGSRLLTALFAAIVGFLLGVVAAFVADKLRRIERSADNEAFFAAWEQFRRDLVRGTPSRAAAEGAAFRP